MFHVEHGLAPPPRSHRTKSRRWNGRGASRGMFHVEQPPAARIIVPKTDPSASDRKGSSGRFHVEHPRRRDGIACGSSTAHIETHRAASSVFRVEQAPGAPVPSAGARSRRNQTAPVVEYPKVPRGTHPGASSDPGQEQSPRGGACRSPGGSASPRRPCHRRPRRMPLRQDRAAPRETHRHVPGRPYRVVSWPGQENPGTRDSLFHVEHAPPSPRHSPPLSRRRNRPHRSEEGPHRHVSGLSNWVAPSPGPRTVLAPPHRRPGAAPPGGMGTRTSGGFTWNRPPPTRRHRPWGRTPPRPKYAGEWTAENTPWNHLGHPEAGLVITGKVREEVRGRLPANRSPLPASEQVLEKTGIVAHLGMRPEGVHPEPVQESPGGEALGVAVDRNREERDQGASLARSPGGLRAGSSGAQGSAVPRGARPRGSRPLPENGTPERDPIEKAGAWSRAMSRLPPAGEVPNWEVLPEAWPGGSTWAHRQAPPVHPPADEDPHAEATRTKGAEQVPREHVDAPGTGDRPHRTRRAPPRRLERLAQVSPLQRKSPPENGDERSHARPDTAAPSDVRLITAGGSIQVGIASTTDGRCRAGGDADVSPPLGLHRVGWTRMREAFREQGSRRGSGRPGFQKVRTDCRE